MDIRKYNKKYILELDEAIDIIKPNLIQAFSIFYGIEYKERIEKIINSISFTYFLSLSYFEVVKNASANINKKYRNIASVYVNYINDLKNNALKIKDLDELEDYYLNNLIIKTPLSLEQLKVNNCLDFLSTPCFSIIEETKGYRKHIFLPIFAIDLEVIVHEINHALMMEVEAIFDEEELIPNLFINENCEELFNDYISYEVINIYLNMGNTIPNALNRFNFISNYKKYFYLIEVFYYVFQNVIKKSIMTRNYNLLWEYAGKDDFTLFCFLVEKYYLSGICLETEFNNLLELIYKMNDYALSIKEIDYNEYLKQLEAKGYVIRRLKR